MGILYFFESIRSPVLDQIMSLITHLGEEAVFLVAALLIFWCVDKNRGYYLMAVGFVGTILNQFLKLVFRIPRPWVRDPNFTIVESARAAATAFPAAIPRTWWAPLPPSPSPPGTTGSGRRRGFR